MQVQPVADRDCAIDSMASMFCNTICKLPIHRTLYTEPVRLHCAAQPSLATRARRPCELWAPIKVPEAKMANGVTSYFRAPKDFSTLLKADPPGAAPATKLVCTVGPVSNCVETLTELIHAGMSMARFDFSFADTAAHQQGLDNLRTAMQQTKRLCAVVMDTLGPEILVLNRPKEPINIDAGQTVTLTSDASRKASSSLLPISYAALSSMGLQPGTTIFVGQYLFTGSETTSAYLTVKEVKKNEVVCICSNACKLEGVQLTVHIGNVKNEAPILGPEDKAAIAGFGVRNQVDFVALSFCRSAQDIHDARAFLNKVGLTSTKIIAKIENKEGLCAHQELIEAADAIVMSRGSMGNCLDAEKMFIAQKMLLRECNLAGKPVYATRVVDTMTEAPRPTRAEATDVANLVLDGADGIVLGSETYRGKFAVAAVETVAAIARQAELSFDNFGFYQYATEVAGISQLNPKVDKTEALATAAVRAATKLCAALIVVFTVTGRTARLIAKYRPSQPILTVVVPRLASDGLKWRFTGGFTARQCLHYRGVTPICADPSLGTPDGSILRAALEHAKSQGMIKDGDRVVVSQCPRAGSGFACMQEAGVVKIVTVSGDLSSPDVSPGARGVLPSHHLIGSTDNLQIAV